LENVSGMKDRLMEIILEKSFQYSEEPIFKLVSGGVSNFYFNCKPTMLDPEGKELIGRLIFSTIRDLEVAGIGGLELGSVPISSAVSLISQLEGQPIKEFIVRKEKKDHVMSSPPAVPPSRLLRRYRSWASRSLKWLSWWTGKK